MSDCDGQSHSFLNYQKNMFKIVLQYWLSRVGGVLSLLCLLTLLIVPSSFARVVLVFEQSIDEASAGVGSLEEGDQFGYSLAVGNFNDDYFADLAVGAPFEDIADLLGIELDNAGFVSILFGSRKGLNKGEYDIQQPVEFNQKEAGLGDLERNDRFGEVLAGGMFVFETCDLPIAISALAIGVPREDITGLVYETGDAGAVAVLLNTCQTPFLNSPLCFDQEEKSFGNVEGDDRFGEVLAVGDFNGDKIDDLAIGVPFEDIRKSGDIFETDDVGFVAVVFGAKSTPFQSKQEFDQQRIKAGSLEEYDRFGQELATGDFNGDGCDDLAIGIPFEDVGNKTSAGFVVVVNGSVNGLILDGQNKSFSQEDLGGNNEYNDRFGEVLATGDFDNDGYDDLAIGVPNETVAGSTFNSGIVHIIYGSVNGLNLTDRQSFTQASSGIPGEVKAYHLFGGALSTGNFNGDGFDDLAIGVPGDDNILVGYPVPIIEAKGSVIVLFGSQTGLNNDREAEQLFSPDPKYGECYGEVLASGDFDIDGADDLVAGVPHATVNGKSSAGRIDVWHGTSIVSIVGQVVDRNSGTSIVGVKVRLLNNNTGDIVAEALSNEPHGSFLFEVPPGQYYLTVSNVDYDDLYLEPFMANVGTEIDHGLILLIPKDSDCDGLSDIDERTIYFTDPAKADTDMDGLTDGEEVSMGTDPNLTDSDGDGILDGIDAVPLSIANLIINNVTLTPNPLVIPDGEFIGLVDFNLYFNVTNVGTFSLDIDATKFGVFESDSRVIRTFFAQTLQEEPIDPIPIGPFSISPGASHVFILQMSISASALNNAKKSNFLTLFGEGCCLEPFAKGTLSISSAMGSDSIMFITPKESNIASIILEAEADTYVRTDLDIRRNDNYGMQEFIMVGTGRGGGGESFGRADAIRAFLRFDITGMPLVPFNAILELSIHSFDGFVPSVFKVGVYRVEKSWVEGNGFEGPRSSGGESGGGPLGSVSPDDAFGLAWEGSDVNNHDQPAFDDVTIITSTTIESAFPAGKLIQWDITSLVQGWISGNIPNNGLLLRDVTTDGKFRGVRFGAREGKLFDIPGSVDAPRLVLVWEAGRIEVGDIIGDGCVDRNDLAILLAVIRGHAHPGPFLDLDLNGDGSVNIADARKLVTFFTNPKGEPRQ